MRRTKLSLLIILFTAPALAQVEDGTYLLISSNTVSPTTPTTTIGIWATWTDPRVEYIFGAGDFDLTAGGGVFSNPANVLNGPGSTTGVIAGNVISGAANGQLHIPPLGIIGSRNNPILLATYDWTTSNFTRRSVSLDTNNTTAFVVQTWDTSFGNSNTRNLFPGSFTPGSGVINVVPAPAVWVVLALPLVAATRRRRS
ncbi:MAG: hypothetical protein IID31_13690 [Planctomycetes bacterium]|nr:hypothetical protein [Planctomycetota bacterium]